MDPVGRCTVLLIEKSASAVRLGGLVSLGNDGDQGSAALWRSSRRNAGQFLFVRGGPTRKTPRKIGTNLVMVEARTSSGGSNSTLPLSRQFPVRHQASEWKW